MRKSGILLHPSSLPGNYGIGTLGNECFKFIDFLESSNQKIWQTFPLGPTTYGDSPYQCSSAFAGNPYLIDLETLVKEGLLTYDDINNSDFSDDNNYVNYGKIYNNKMEILKKAYKNFKEDSDFFMFVNKEKNWLDDYSIFSAIKEHFNGLSWLSWDEDIKNREYEALEKYEKLLSNEIKYQKFLQYIFFKQWSRVKKYANMKKIEILGDIPFFVGIDSADVWVNSHIFLLDENKNPEYVAAIPPDFFSSTGQLWGNPVYNWEILKKEKYKWWIERIKKNMEIFDVLRFDHFTAFVKNYVVLNGSIDALNGIWKKGPNNDFFIEVKKQIGDISVVVEDLGIITDDVIKLKDENKFMGMKVLQFAFDDNANNIYLPHNYEKNSVVYTGTHDNDTIMGWHSNLNDNEKSKIRDYLDVFSDEGINHHLIRLAMRSVSNVCIVPIQDYLGLNSDSRMNSPSKTHGNWQWRLNEFMLDDNLSKYIAHITKIYGRI